MPDQHQDETLAHLYYVPNQLIIDTDTPLLGIRDLGAIVGPKQNVDSDGPSLLEVI